MLRDDLDKLPKENLITLIMNLYDQINEEKERSYGLEMQLLNREFYIAQLKYYEEYYDEQQKEKP